jgi:hypothetical protein
MIAFRVSNPQLPIGALSGVEGSPTFEHSVADYPVLADARPPMGKHLEWKSVWLRLSSLA